MINNISANINNIYTNKTNHSSASIKTDTVSGATMKPDTVSGATMKSGGDHFFEAKA